MDSSVQDRSNSIANVLERPTHDRMPSREEATRGRDLHYRISNVIHIYRHTIRWYVFLGYRVHYIPRLLDHSEVKIEWCDYVLRFNCLQCIINSFLKMW